MSNQAKRLPSDPTTILDANDARGAKQLAEFWGLCLDLGTHAGVMPLIHRGSLWEIDLNDVWSISVNATCHALPSKIQVHVWPHSILAIYHGSAAFMVEPIGAYFIGSDPAAQLSDCCTAIYNKALELQKNAGAS